MEDTRYLEIGTWMGSSVCSALYNNNIICVCIDDFSRMKRKRCRFTNAKERFLINFNKFKGNNNAKFIESNCWKVNVSELEKFNIYLYDGDHSKDSHYQAINYFLGCLDNVFIYLVDDWNDDEVRKGTLESIENNKLIIKYKKEIFTKSNSNKNDWHNGICIFVLTKN